MISKNLIRKTQERKRNLHRSFLEDLSDMLLPKLFLELGISDYKIKNTFVEPRSNPPFKEEISPDLVIAYTNPDLNLLLVEAKISSKLVARRNLDEELSFLKSYAEGSTGTLYEILGQKVPLEALQSCGILSVGIYRTKKGKFKIYRTEKLR